jgi:sigma-54-interacting transcriptional regulator
MANVKTDGSGPTFSKGMKDDQGARDAALDWYIAKAKRCHVLVVGSADATEHSLAALMPHLDPPVCCWTTDTLLPSSGDAKTLVIRNVDTLSTERQRELLSWLEQATVVPIRVVSTTTVPLFQRVAAGLFLDDLYYQLNTVILYAAEGVSDGADNPPPQLAKTSEPASVLQS